LTVEGGEALKTLPKARWIWKKLYQYQLDRGQSVGLIGGGSLLDVGGFCAATWKRGIPFVSVPTTLVSQVDAAIGGKTGLNFRQGKNLIGVYAQPRAIWGWPNFLESLPQVELRSGWIEVFKHALIAGGGLWEGIQQVSVEKPPALALLKEAAGVKVQIVRADPFEEKRLRFVLNLGHTLGHVWESLSQERERPLLHGEAVAIGLAQEVYLSYRLGHLSEADLEKVVSWLSKRQYLRPLPPFTWKDWEKFLFQDKKVRTGRLFMPLLRGIGEALPAEEVGIKALKEAVRWYQGQYGSTT
jgi:3-dehydroquinate synthase